MLPVREACIGGCHLVREYARVEELIVYLDQRLQEGKSFEEVCRETRERSRALQPARP